MTLHALRMAVGDQAFFRILRTWASTRRGGTVTTPEFIDLAERISGRSLDALFQAWLFGSTRPEAATPPGAATTGLKIRVPSPMIDRRSRR
jgi:aminopeptidase N